MIGLKHCLIGLVFVMVCSWANRWLCKIAGDAGSLFMSSQVVPSGQLETTKIGLLEDTCSVLILLGL